MYDAHFGLSRRPFAPGPDSGPPYPATAFEQAVAALIDALADGETFATLTGPPGVGKSLAARVFVERLGVPTAFVNTAVNSPAGLLQALLFDLGLPHEGRSEQEMRLALVDHFLQGFTAGTPAVIVIDDAHLLAARTLEELRLLGNLEGAVRIVLIGQPRLEATLAMPELTALRQRVVARAALPPLGVEEAADYVLHHLRIAGASDGLVSTEALELVARSTRGVPRLLNQATHRALRIAAVADAEAVDVEAMMEALDALGLSATEADETDEVRLVPPDPVRVFAPAHRA